MGRAALLCLVTTAILLPLAAGSPALAQDRSPFKGMHVWLPMTGYSEADVEDARRAGYDTILLKVHPPVIPGGGQVDFAALDAEMERLRAKGFRFILAILGWVGLGDGEFWDTRENGERVMNQLDPFWPEAMERVEWYFAEIIRRYASHPDVVAFAPTWGIYGEAGFTSWDAGRSGHALARFNEWRAARGLPALERIPARPGGPDTEFNRFILFRYQYVQEAFSAMVSRLKPLADGRPVGMWQELYNVMGYLWNMVEIPSADFALYESCFPFQTSHDPERTLAETMGFRYRCLSAAQYRDYYLPLLARKRGEGQRFMGCQLTRDYAVANYGWAPERAARVRFEQWEDEFSPYLQSLHNAPLEAPKRDVLMVFPSYTAAALPDHPCYAVDSMLLDVLLRSFGCQMRRCGSPRLDAMSVAEMDRYRLIVVPAASFLLSETWQKLKSTKAVVLLTGSFGRAMDGVQVPDGQEYAVDGGQLSAGMRPSGLVTLGTNHPLTCGMGELLTARPVVLAEDDAFRWLRPPAGTEILLRCGDEPLLSVRRRERLIFLHGQVFAASCFNPARRPPRNLGGSSDASANEVDVWGPYDSADPRNWFGMELVRRILDYAGVRYRVPQPPPRTVARYLGDHIEAVSLSANLAYNNTARARTITVRTPYPVAGVGSVRCHWGFESRITVPAFGWVALQPEEAAPGFVQGSGDVKDR
jgi:hypothetical protein